MSDKSNAVTDDEFVETDELLASIPVEAEAMDLAEADGFMTAVQLLPKTADLYPNARKHDAIESRESSFGDIQRQKEINTDITQKRSEERMKPRLSKKDLLATDEPAPKKKNAFKK